MQNKLITRIINTIFLIILLACTKVVLTDKQACCESTNVIFSNHTCWNGKNVTALPCDMNQLMGTHSKIEGADIDLEFDDEDNLIISNDDYGSIVVSSDKYCITKLNSTNGSTFPLVCHNKKVVKTGPTSMQYLKNICGFISLLFFLPTFAIYAGIKELRDVEGKIILNFIAAMGLMHIVATLFTFFEYVDPTSCDRTAFAFYFFFFLAYNWLSVFSFHFWRLAIRPQFQTRIEWYMLYCCYGYGLPALLGLTTIITHLSREQFLKAGYDQCWYESGAYTILVYFYGPVFLTLILSVVLQLWAVKKVWIDVDSRMREEYVAVLRKKSQMYTHVLLIMATLLIGDLFTFLFLHESDALDVIWDLVDCRNLLTGGALFFIFVVLRNKVLRALAKNGLFGCGFPSVWIRLEDEELEKKFRKMKNDISTL